MARRGPRIVSCYHCGHRFEVGGKAESTSCEKCNQRVIVGDIVVKALMPVKTVETCGRIVVKRKGSVIAETAWAGDGVEIQGSIDAHVVSGGPVVIGRFAKWKGDCQAPSLEVAQGARIAGGAFAVPAKHADSPSSVDDGEAGGDRVPNGGAATT